MEGQQTQKNLSQLSSSKSSSSSQASEASIALKLSKIAKRLVDKWNAIWSSWSGKKIKPDLEYFKERLVWKSGSRDEESFYPDTEEMYPGWKEDPVSQEEQKISSSSSGEPNDTESLHHSADQKRKEGEMKENISYSNVSKDFINQIGKKIESGPLGSLESSQKEEQEQTEEQKEEQKGQASSVKSLEIDISSLSSHSNSSAKSNYYSRPFKDSKDNLSALSDNLLFSPHEIEGGAYNPKFESSGSEELNVETENSLWTERYINLLQVIKSMVEISIESMESGDIVKEFQDKHLKDAFIALMRFNDA